MSVHDGNSYLINSYRWESGVKALAWFANGRADERGTSQTGGGGFHLGLLPLVSEHPGEEAGRLSNQTVQTKRVVGQQAEY